MSKTLAQKAREKGININTVRARIRYGWSEHKALNTPVDKKFHQKKQSEENDLAIRPTNQDPWEVLDSVADYSTILIAVAIIAAVAGILWRIL